MRIHSDSAKLYEITSRKPITEIGYGLDKDDITESGGLYWCSAIETKCLMIWIQLYLTMYFVLSWHHYIISESVDYFHLREYASGDHGILNVDWDGYSMKIVWLRICFLFKPLPAICRSIWEQHQRHVHKVDSWYNRITIWNRNKAASYRLTLQMKCNKS